MSCENWNDRLIGRLYDEISPEDAAAFDAHLNGCEDCRHALDGFQRVRGVLSADEPSVAATPRVVVLRDRRSWRPLAVAASILGAALLSGAGAGAGYALGQRHATTPGGTGAPSSPPVVSSPSPVSLDAATEAMIRREIDRRWEARAASLASSAPAEASPAPDAVSAAELRAELARFERKINANRATDLDYMLGEIQAAEYRTESRIGKTNEALRTVALASNGYVSAQ